jgi:hypothetical protein
MKKILLSALLGVFCFSLVLTSCGNGGNNEGKQDSVVEEIKADTVKKAAPDTKTAKYMCPMKCEGSFSAENGKCPKCGMDKIENPDFGK